MAIQIVKTFTVKAPPDRVWQFMIDPHRVAGCMPGAAITSQVDDRTFTGTMTVKVGPVTTSYKGKIVFQRMDAAERAAEIVATGQDVKGKGGADMKLSSTLKEIAPGETEITAVSELTITGLLAQMGRGMIQDVSDQLFQIFSQRVKSELETEVPATAPAEASGTPTGEAPHPAGASQPGTRSSSSGRPADSALDLGSIGASAARRAAVRMFSRPPFWIGIAVIAVIVYLLFIR